MADSNTVALRYLAETTWGTTPSAAMTGLPFVSESIAEQEEEVRSASIYPDRQVRSTKRTGRGSGGNIEFELIYGAYDNLLAGLLCDEWDSDVLANGTEKKSFTLEKQIFVDGSPSSHFLIFPGFVFGTGELRFSLGANVTGSIGGLGKAMTPSATQAGSGSPNAAAEGEVMSVTDITSVTWDSGEIPGATELSISINNNLRIVREIGNVQPYRIGFGTFDVTGSLAAYFTNRDLLSDYVSDTRAEIEVAVEDSAGNSYTFSIPRAKLGAPQVVTPGQNSDVTVQIPFSAEIDEGGTGKTIIMARASGS